MCQNAAPPLDELLFVDDLIAFWSGRQIRAGRCALVMDDRTLRLKIHALARLANSEAIVRIFVVTGLVSFVETPELFEQLALRGQKRTGAIVDLPQKAEQGMLDVLGVTPEVGGGSVAENKTTCFLQRSFGIDQLSPDGASIGTLAKDS